MTIRKLLRPVTRPVQQTSLKWTRRIAIYVDNMLNGEAGKRRRRARRMVIALENELHRLGFSRRVGVGGHKRRKVVQRRVRFRSPLLLTREELWIPIDLQKLPPGVTTNDMRDEDALRSIEDRLNTSCRIDYLASGEICFVLRMAAGAAFPQTFAINAFRMPADAAQLAMPLGIDGQGEHQSVDLAKMPHMLIVGPTGKGKSTFIHAMISTWISRNAASDIELWLADHKGGVELDRYKALQGNRQRPGIVRRISYRPEDTIEFLRAALTELDRRNELLRKSDASDVDDYGRSTGQHLRRIAIVIDEIFFLMLNKEVIDPEIGKSSEAKKGRGRTVSDWAEHLLSKIASAGRAAGIHLVIATQRTGKDVLTPLITANFETRLVFGMADMYQSIYVIGSADAVGLPRGRALFRPEGGSLLEIQTPLIKPDQIRLAISRISRYGPDGGLGSANEARRFRDDAKLLLLVASEEFEGKLSVDKVFQHPRIKGVLRRDRIDEIVRRLERDGVLEPGGPRRARRLSAGFMNRPQLLDAMYGGGNDQNMAGNDSGIDSFAESDMMRLGTPERHQDAENNTPEAEPITPYTRPNQAHTPPDETE